MYIKTSLFLELLLLGLPLVFVNPLFGLQPFVLSALSTPKSRPFHTSVAHEARVVSSSSKIETCKYKCSTAHFGSLENRKFLVQV